MKLIVRGAVLLAAILGAEGVVFAVLQKNLSDGLYPIEADSIGLPLGTSAVVLLVFAALVIVSFFATSSSRWLRYSGIAALAAASLLAVSYGLYWANSDHWPIAITFCLLAFAAPLSAIVETRRNSSRRGT